MAASWKTPAKRPALALLGVVAGVNLLQFGEWMEPTTWMFIDLCAISYLAFGSTLSRIVAGILSGRVLLHGYQMKCDLPDLLYHEIANGFFILSLLAVALWTGWYLVRLR